MGTCKGEQCFYKGCKYKSKILIFVSHLLQGGYLQVINRMFCYGVQWANVSPGGGGEGEKPGKNYHLGVGDILLCDLSLS